MHKGEIFKISAEGRSVRTYYFYINREHTNYEVRD